MENNQGNKLGKKIKKLRTGLGLSQDELARKADVPYTTLTKIETGVKKAFGVCSGEDRKGVGC